MADEMTKSEKSWLRGISGEIDFGDPALPELFPAQTLEQARQAFVLLTR